MKKGRTMPAQGRVFLLVEIDAFECPIPVVQRVTDTLTMMSHVVKVERVNEEVFDEDLIERRTKEGIAKRLREIARELDGNRF